MKKLINLCSIIILAITCLIYTNYTFALTIQAPSLSGTNSRYLFPISNIVKGNILYGYIDNSGKIVINPSFDKAHDFKDGLARIEFGNYEHGYKSGFINQTGKVVVKPIYEDDGCGFEDFFDIFDFSEGLAIIKILSKGEYTYGFIDKSGKYTIAPQYYHAEDFHGGLAKVIIHDNKDYYCAYINQKNKIIWKRKLTNDEKHP